MQRKIYNKLVRDGIPDHLDSLGLAYETYSMEDDAVFEHQIRRKIMEEATELVAAQTRGELTTEIADLYEVIQLLLVVHGISKTEVEAVRLEKLAKKGGFSKRLELVWSE